MALRGAFSIIGFWKEEALVRFLVTGGLGFIGSSVVRFLIRNTPCEVLVVDSITYAAIPLSVKEVEGSDRYSFQKVDICDFEATSTVVNKFKPDVIMHLAAETHVDRSIDGPSVFIQTNIVGTYNLLEVSKNYYEALDKASRERFRFHHVSTDEVYGTLCADDEPFTELSRYDPRSPYSASKSASDHLVRAWGETFRLPITISNCSNNYGPWQYPDKLIPLLIARGCDQKTLPIYGKGENIRDWLHVEDHAEALVSIAMRGRVGQSYNIGGGAERTNLQVARAVCDVLDEIRPEAGPHSSLIDFVEDRPGHDFRYAINFMKIQTELGWRPRRSFESGLRETINWYLDNEPWWRDIVMRTDAGNRLGLVNKHQQEQGSGK